MDILFFVVAFLSSIVGAICGIGGGVVIKRRNGTAPAIIIGIKTISSAKFWKCEIPAA